jgi:acetolactate synthase-1/2/3 large subunit
MNGADRLCDVLLANDVNVCFANPGTSEMHFVAALDAKPEMRCVLGLFEGVVTGAADGYARMTDRPAATLLHTGPGLANALANLHNARRAHSRMINVVGDHASHHLKYDAPLTSDIDSLAAPMSNWVRHVTGPEDVGPAAEAAYLASLDPPGIATLILPADSAWGQVAPKHLTPLAVPGPRPVDPSRVRAAADAIRTAARGRVGLLVSGRAGRADALESAGRIAAATSVKLFAPVFQARTERGRGRVPITAIPYPIDLALQALKDIDLLVLVGAPEPVAFFGYPGKPSRLVPEGCRVITLAEHGEDLPAALNLLADELGALRVAPIVSNAPQPAEAGRPGGALTEDAVAVIVAQMLAENAIVVDEGLTSARRFGALSENGAPHDFMTITGGAIGGGIPMAVGAGVACPDRKVVTLQADGSGMYTVQGLWTQARENLDVVTVIFSNRAYAILQIEMRNVGVAEFGRNANRMMRLDDPALDWVKLAEGMGVEAVRATTAEGFASAFEAAMKRRGPFLIEAVI